MDARVGASLRQRPGVRKGQIMEKVPVLNKAELMLLMRQLYIPG